jgi:hypothetical protein
MDVVRHGVVVSAISAALIILMITTYRHFTTVFTHRSSFRNPSHLVSLMFIYLLIPLLGTLGSGYLLSLAGSESYSTYVQNTPGATVTDNGGSQSEIHLATPSNTVFAITLLAALLSLVSARCLAVLHRPSTAGAVFLGVIASLGGLAVVSYADSRLVGFLVDYILGRDFLLGYFIIVGIAFALAESSLSTASSVALGGGENLAGRARRTSSRDEGAEGSARNSGAMPIIGWVVMPVCLLIVVLRALLPGLRFDSISLALLILAALACVPGSSSILRRISTLRIGPLEFQLGRKLEKLAMNRPGIAGD